MIIFLLIWAMNVIGLFCLAATMSKHQKQMFGQELSMAKTRIARLLGWLFLILAVLLTLSHFVPSNAISYWVGVLTFAALFTGLCLSYLAEYTRRIGIAVLVIMCVSAILHYI